MTAFLLTMSIHLYLQFVVYYYYYSVQMAFSFFWPEYRLEITDESLCKINAFNLTG
jgi:hypothetical protein